MPVENIIGACWHQFGHINAMNGAKQPDSHKGWRRNQQAIKQYRYHPHPVRGAIFIITYSHETKSIPAAPVSQQTPFPNHRRSGMGCGVSAAKPPLS
jgi:hypothetical protein